MDIVLKALRVLASLFMGILLYLGITGLILGSTFVIREALLFFFGVDIYEIMKKWAPKAKSKPKKKQEPLTESDELWLKNRGRY